MSLFSFLCLSRSSTFLRLLSTSLTHPFPTPSAEHDFAFAIRYSSGILDRVKRGSYYNNHGGSLQYLEQFPEAADEYRHALSLQPKNVRYHMNLVVCLKAMEKYEEAESVVKTALSLEPYVLEWYWSGERERKRREWAGGEARLREKESGEAEVPVEGRRERE